MNSLRLDETAKLANASLIIGLSGWGNAGEVSTLSVSYLIEKLNANPMGEIVSDKFYNYQLQRPFVSIEKGLVKEYRPPLNRIFHWKNEERKHALLLFLGVEPHLDWPGYTRAVLDAAESVGAQRIFTIGGYVSDIPHTMKPLITGSTNNHQLLAELKRVGAEFTDYAGPTSVYSEILWQGKTRSIDVISLWGAVPQYIQGSNPKVVHSLLEKLLLMVGVEVDLEDIEQKAEALDKRLATEARNNPQLRRLIIGLEKEYMASSTRPFYTV